VEREGGVDRCVERVGGVGQEREKEKEVWIDVQRE